MRSAGGKAKTSVQNEIPAGVRRLWIIVSICVFAVSLAVLWWNAAPSVTFHDSGEFAMAAASAGIPHPPGAPTWTILATIFVKLFAFHDPARGTNLFSGLCGAITLALLCGLMQLWVYLLFPSSPRWMPPASGITSVLLLLHSSAFLEQSFITEQYTLLTALIAGMALTATAIVLREKAGRANTRLCGLLGLLWGLAIGNHLSQVALGLLAAWAVWVGSRRGDRVKAFAALGGGLILGLMVFLWLPIRSRANPLMDWGNIKTLDRFMWAITRQQWETRPISEAPRNVIGEWMTSYDLIGQIGIVGILLAVSGMLVLVKKQRMWLGWLAAIAIPYGAGMLLGHLRQKTVGIDFITSYGILDWHLPIYVTLAMATAIGFGAVVSRMYERRVLVLVWVFVAAVGTWLILTAGFVVKQQSMRGFAATDEYMRALLAPLPPDAAITAAQDNIAFTIGYRRWVMDPESRLWVAIRATRPHFVMDEIGGHATPDECRAELLRLTIADPNWQPMRVPPAMTENAHPPRVFCDFMPEHPEDAPFLLPAGYLFEFAGRRTSNAEVREAERRWRDRCPNLFTNRAPDSHRLECEAYARLHMERGHFFGRRGMWNEAVDAYQHSVEWEPANGATWFYLADALEHIKELNRAADAYKQAIMLVPMYSAPRYNLAMIYARSGEYEAAEVLLVDALRISPDDKDAREKLAAVRKKLGRGG